MKCFKPFRVQYYLSQGSQSLGIFGQVLWLSVSISTFTILCFMHAFSLRPLMLSTNMMENPLPCVLLRDKIRGNIILFKLSLYITWSEKQLQKTYTMLSTWVLNSTEDRLSPGYGSYLYPLLTSLCSLTAEPKVVNNRIYPVVQV